MKTELIPIVLRPPAPDHPRSPGVHVSNIIRNLAVQNGALKPEWVNLEDLGLSDAGNEKWWNALDPVSRLRMSIGLAWEAWYIPQLEGVQLHPGEMQLDGIYLTHDGESLDVVLTPDNREVYELALHEIKATYKSVKTVGNLDSQFMWKAQTKAYCKGLGTTVAYLHVLFLCGDYTYPISPQIKCWRIDYEQWEIDQQWEEIVDYLRHYQQQEREEQMRDTI